MEKSSKNHDKPILKPPFNFYYSNELQSYVIEVLNGEFLYPCRWKDPEAGIRKIIKTKKNGLQMC
jgi:hypothetical protein